MITAVVNVITIRKLFMRESTKHAVCTLGVLHNGFVIAAKIVPKSTPQRFIGPDL